MPRLLCALVAVLLLLGVPGPAQAVESETGLGIRLLDAPVERRDDPRAAVYVVDHLAPGDTIRRRVEVVNGTGAPLTARLYAGAAEVRDGRFTGLAEGAAGELASWTRVDRGSVTLAPRARQAVEVVVSVPRDAAPGERYGVVWAETSGGTGSTTQVNRVGVRLYVSVGPGGEPASDFEITTLQAERDAEGRPVVTAQVRNSGGRALDLRGELELSEGPGGLSAGPFAATLGTTLAPGDTSGVTVVLDEAIAGGPWRAVLSLSSGTLQRRAEATITFPDEAGVRAQVVTAEELPLGEDPSVLVPVASGLIALVLLALLLLLLRLRALRGRAEPQEQGA